MKDDKEKKIGLVRKAILIEWILIGYNSLEAIASILVGYLAGSIALVGFGLDSIIEIAAASMLIWRLSHKGSEEEETKKERIAVFFVGVTFFLLAIYILYESGSKLIHHEKPEASYIGIIIAILSLIIMPTLGLMKRKIARQIKSRALEADAVETLLCSYLSLTLLLGLGLNALFGWWWADPVAGLIMIYFLVKEGWEAISGEDTCCDQSNCK